MTVEAKPGPSTAPDSPPAAVRRLLRWYQPYLAGHGRLMVGVVAGTVVVISCQALIPWLVEVILHGAKWNSLLIAILVGLVVLQLGVGYATHLGVHLAANAGALALRSRMFGTLLRSRVLRQDGLQRSGVVLRVTQDVDSVSVAYETSLAYGIPGLARLIVSLALLTAIEWPAGVTMTIASLAFLFVRRRIGPALAAADQHRLEAQSAVGETVDETITNAPLITGMRLGRWQEMRFGKRALHLDHSTHRLGVILNRLILAAHTTALVGLIAVVVFAFVRSTGHDDLAVIAAALLYVEGAIRGLEALPPWIRDVQRAGVSQQRISQLLDEPDATPTTASGESALPTHGVVGVVTGPGVDVAEVITQVAGTVPGDVLVVPAQSETLDATPAELFAAVAPDIPASSAEACLAAMGLDDLASNTGAMDTPMGPHGQMLTVDERQRLLAAVALAARPSVLAIGPVLALGDLDSALALVSALRSERSEVTVLPVQSTDMAEAVDSIVFDDGADLHHGTHQQLLVESPAYASLWEQRLAPMEIDLSVLGIGADAEDRLKARLVTEHYSPGDLLYRQGSSADRILFIISGHVEITTTAAGQSRRVAVIGPGNHCGDLRLTVGERRAESATALDDCVVRSLSRQAITAGLTGLLDRTPVERRIVESLLRRGPATREELVTRLPGMDEGVIATSLALLMQDGAAREDDGVVSAVFTRAGRTGSQHILDRLTDL